MIPYTYTYFFGTLLFMAPWLYLFAIRKDLRKEMIYIGILGAMMSVVTGYLWLTYDWWHPLTITNTRVGFEDLLLGFANGGVGAVLYYAIHQKKIIRVTTPRKAQVVYLIFCILIGMLIFIWGFGLSSFFASVLCMCIAIFWTSIVRRDMIYMMIQNGIYMVILSIPVYLLCEFVSPGWIGQTWYMDKLSNVLIANIPIEDIIFYFQAGALCPIFYKVWNGTG